MKKIGFLLLVLTLSRVAVAYAATTSTPVTNQNFFFGNTAAGTAAMNQVLALLVGPKGPPGPAGVAGKDGFVGLNGQNGKDGLPGAPGAIGPQGIPGAKGETGTAGARGPTGPAGTNGIDGTNGSGGSGGNVSFADGQILVGSCQPVSETVTVSVDRYFTGTEFHFADFNFSGLNANCGAKVLTVDLVMANTISAGKTYLANDEIVCRYTLPTPPASTTTVSDLNSTCSIYRNHVNTNTALRLDAVNTLDFTGAIGFQIAG